ncbi:MAG: DsbA family protein [Acetobacteraceae bacterium]|nr:DsbA family protein [Acetobacteraceae bacterium]
MNPSRRLALLAAALAPAAAWAQDPGPSSLPPLPGERSIGRADAPVTVVEFHSLTCGNCARFHNEVFPRIQTEFVDTGLVRFVLRDFPLDQVALLAAAATHCAGPERFAPMVALLYAQKESWAHAADPRAFLRRFAGLAGVGPEQLDRCWGSPEFLRPIGQSRWDAERQHGISATPSFLIGGRVHRGVLTFDQFSALVRPLLPSAARRP